MRWIMALLALTIAAPAWAQAQQPGLPVWEIGTWCTDLAPDVTTCVVYEEPRDGAMTTRTELTTRGVKKVISRSQMTVEEGRIVTRTPAAGTSFREIARGPNDLTMENAVAKNVADGDAKTVRFIVDGDDLTVEIGFEKEPSVVQRYKRAKP